MWVRSSWKESWVSDVDATCFPGEEDACTPRCGERRGARIVKALVRRGAVIVCSQQWAAEPRPQLSLIQHSQAMRDAGRHCRAETRRMALLPVRAHERQDVCQAQRAPVGLLSTAQTLFAIRWFLGCS
jgi:hypothetical protein